MKAEDFLGVVVTVAATFVLIFGHCETIIWKYELLSWATGLLFILLYNLEIFRPKSKKFNFIVSYIGLSIAVFLGQYMMTDYSTIIVAFLLVIFIILLLLSEYVP